MSLLERLKGLWRHFVDSIFHRNGYYLPPFQENAPLRGHYWENKFV